MVGVFGGALGLISCSHSTEHPVCLSSSPAKSDLGFIDEFSKFIAGKTEGKRTISSFFFLALSFKNKKINTWTPGRCTNRREKSGLESSRDPVGDGCMVTGGGMGKENRSQTCVEKENPLEYSTATIGFMIKIG